MADKVGNFLKIIGQIESSGGKNTNHPMVTSGPQAGDSAIGTYGLMPNTIDEVAQRSSDPEIRTLADMDSDEKHDYLTQHPELQDQIARSLAEKVLSKQNGDEQRAAFAWNAGSNLSPDGVEKRDYLNSDYVKKYSKLANLMGGSNPTNLSDDDKAQVLNYVGANDPSRDIASVNPSTTMAAGSVGGLGGMGMKDMLEHNAAQNSQRDQMLASLSSAPGQTVGRPPGKFGYTDPTTKPVPTDDTSDDDQQLPVIKPQATFPISTAKPTFNAINQLIAKYNRGK